MSNETKFFSSKAENEKSKNDEIQGENDKVVSSPNLNAISVMIYQELTTDRKGNPNWLVKR